MRSWVGLLIAALASACAPAAGPTVTRADDGRPRIEAEFIIPPGSAFPAAGELRFGGLSGVVPFDGGRQLLALSDDRENSRMYELRLHGGGSSLRVVPTRVISLQTGAGAPVALDPEGIALLESGHVLISSEGIGEEEPRLPPAILEYTRAGRFVRQWRVPFRYVPNERGPLRRGVLPNAGFESLTITPDHRHVFTANELPLVQDGEADAFAAGARVRILRYTRRGEEYGPDREFAYEIAPLEAVPFVPGFAINGVVELLALSAEDLLVLERGFVQSADRKQAVNRIRIFRISLAGASDVSTVESLQVEGLQAARKTLAADLNALPGLSPSLRNLDNFEGLARAPGRSDGSVLVVSDDNFNARQVTAFLRVALK